MKKNERCNTIWVREQKKINTSSTRLQYISLYQFVFRTARARRTQMCMDPSLYRPRIVCATSNAMVISNIIQDSEGKKDANVAGSKFIPAQKCVRDK